MTLINRIFHSRWCKETKKKIWRFVKDSESQRSWKSCGHLTELKHQKGDWEVNCDKQDLEQLQEEHTKPRKEHRAPRREGKGVCFQQDSDQ